VSPLLRHAEEILDTAMAGSHDLGIIIGRQGDLRMVDPAGWSLPAMRSEFGAVAVYKVERHGRTVRVEGWDGDRSCRLERTLSPALPARWPRTLPALT
jgi:hypothetical protein